MQIQNNDNSNKRDNYNRPQDPLIRLNRLIDGQPYHLTLSNELEWVVTIAKELSEESVDESDSMVEAAVTGKISFKKIRDTALQDILVLDGELDATFSLNCIRCLKPTPQEVALTLSAVFLDESFITSEEYGDLTELYVDNALRELHFQEQKELRIDNFIRESIILQVEPFPLHDEDCKGLCQQCGADMNEESCPHSNN